MNVDRTAALIALDDDELTVTIAALRERAAAPNSIPEAGTLADRLQFGVEFYDAKDELIQLDVRRRLLDAEVKRVKARMETLRELLDEDWRERGITSERLEDGTLLHRTRGRVFASVVKPDGADSAPPDVRQAACDALKTAELGDYVAEGFNGQSLGAYFKELSDAYDEAQRLLPENERTPKEINDFLPEPLRGLIALTDNPTISIRRS